jgi:hypothetical protein
MTQEEKILLLKDLCGRIPYGVKVHFGSEPWTLTGLFKSEHAGVMVILLPRFTAANAYPNTSNWPLEKVKPYLRPLSSMTDEEKYQYEKTQWEYQADYCAPEYFDGLESYDWLNAHFFDFRGLIDKGLALEAKEGMYIS